MDNNELIKPVLSESALLADPFFVDPAESAFVGQSRLFRDIGLSSWADRTDEWGSDDVGDVGS